jgi:signal transduction histidine kinase/DNA-binding response OmpR family regulator
MPETFLEEMKRYVGFTREDAEVLASLAPVMEPYLPALAERFYEQIPRHAEAAAVFTGGETQIARLRLTLQHWARGLFSGVYEEAYANERFRIGYRHVQIGLPQRYVISAMHVVTSFLRQVIDREIDDPRGRRRANDALDRIINLDLGLICETYFEGSLRELRRLNDRLSAVNRSLEEANRAKADFLATTSHELRTPLTSIIGFSRILLDGYVNDPAEQRDLLADVHRSALHLLSLVDDVLDLSRIEAGRLEVATTHVDVAASIAEVVALTKVQADEKGLALQTNISPALPQVVADPSRLRQVLLNTIGNAIKFTERGEIRVIASVDSDKATVRVDVTDTGIGIPAEKQSLLFEKFRQVDASHTRKHGGAGLGLAISRALIERMGGRIDLRSEGADQGTTVSFTLPAVLLREAASITPEKGATRSVLLAGTDPGTRQRIASALTAEGYRVRESATAEGVRGLVRAEQPDVLLIDLTADDGGPTREWFDLLMTLQSDPVSKNIKPVVLTDSSAKMATSVQLEMLASLPTVIDKPVEAGKLRQALDRILPLRGAVPFRVLVADDDPLVFKFVTNVLPPHEYIVLHATNGAEVIRAVETQRFDALLLDLRMPTQSGYDVIRALKLEGRAPDLPILVITNYPAPSDAQEQALLSSSLILDVLPKPDVAEHPDLLLQRLEAVRRER